MKSFFFRFFARGVNRALHFASFSIAAVRGLYAGLAWVRQYAGPLQVVSRLGRFFLKAFVFAHAALFAATLAACILLSRWNPPVTSLMIYRNLTVQQKPLPLKFVPLRELPRSFRLMFIRLEDMNFYRHPGISLGAIRDAYLINKSIGYTLYGGSTIPQQLARTLFLTPRKTYMRKYVEALIALEMDLLLKKERILELYLNYIEWGKGVYGIGAASFYYYGSKPAGLSIDQFRRLAAILPNPLRFNVNTFANSHQMSERYKYLLEKFPDPSPATEPDSADSTSPRKGFPSAP